MRLVVDASVALKWFLQGRPGELGVDRAEAIAAAIARSPIELFAPVHWEAEIVSALARIEPGLIEDALVVLDDMRPVINGGVPVLRLAADLSVTLNHHLFDTLYHAVALEEQATLVTADEAYFIKAKDRGDIQLLRDFRAS
jgi:predicted nucleic acid-binding protein